MRQVIVAGNWKMNASKETVNTLIMGVLSGMAEVDSTVIVCAPFPYMSQVEALITHSQLHLGAQDLNVNASGAFTGEVSADMIKDFGAKYVVVGHSERRSMYGETDELVAQKVQAALDNHLTPLFCIGETLEEREGNNMETVVSRQIQAVIDRVGIEAVTSMARVSSGLWLPYAVLLICVEFHAGIGLYRLAVKWGAGTWLSRPVLRIIEHILLWFFLGLGVVILLVLAGVISPPLAFLLQGGAA